MKQIFDKRARLWSLPLLFLLTIFINESFKCNSDNSVYGVASQVESDSIPCYKLTDSALSAYRRDSGMLSIRLIDESIQCDSNSQLAWSYKVTFLIGLEDYNKLLITSKKVSLMFPELRADMHSAMALAYFNLGDSVNFKLHRGEAIAEYKNKFEHQKTLANLMQYAYAVKYLTGVNRFELFDENIDVIKIDHGVQGDTSKMKEQMIENFKKNLSKYESIY